jgi:hypothetical protein
MGVDGAYKLWDAVLSDRGLHELFELVHGHLTAAARV